MRNNRLISMVDFVLSESQCAPISEIQFADRVCNYANFLKQPLSLGMFVPCRSDGKPLETPIEPEAPYNDKKCDIWEQYEFYKNRYDEAKEAVLFDGYQVIGFGSENGDVYCELELKGKNLWVVFNSGDISIGENNYCDGRVENVEDFLNICKEEITLTPTALKTIYG